MEELTAEALNELRTRFQTCELLTNAFDVENQPDIGCKDSPCFDVCPVQRLEPVTPEKRNYKRKSVSMSILFGEKLEHAALTSDMSLGGMGIRSEQLFAPGTAILIGIPDQSTCLAEARVIWINKNSVEANLGVVFVRMTNEFAKHLQSILTAQR